MKRKEFERLSNSERNEYVLELNRSIAEKETKLKRLKEDMLSTNAIIKCIAAHKEAEKEMKTDNPKEALERLEAAKEKLSRKERKKLQEAYEAARKEHGISEAVSIALEEIEKETFKKK